MKIHINLMIAMFVCLLLAETAFATDDFQARPPVFVWEEHDRRDDINLADPSQTMPEYLNFEDYYILRDTQVPLLYFSLGIQTESTFFDKRLNWSTYSTQLVVDNGSLGVRYQGNMSSVGRDGFEFYDNRLDVYSYWLLDIWDEKDFDFARVGGGLSYFDCDPYRGQEFLDDQHFAAFTSFYFVFAELKFAMMINDDIWNGGLVELKIFNPFLYFGFQVPKYFMSTDMLLYLLNLVCPFELGLTGSFGLPNDADGWGWFIKGRYNFLFHVLNKRNDDNLILGAEIYWSYRDGFSNTNVSGGWEFGIKFTLVGF